MSLSRAERFKLKSQIVSELTDADGGWDMERTNLLFAEFGLPRLGRDWNGPSVDELVAAISDTALVELYAVVMDIDQQEVSDVVEGQGSGNWKQGYVKVFLSHSAKHKEFIGHVADELAVVGIHGFVAHDTMAYSKPWQDQIEQGLRSMEAFVAIIHPEFLDSAWCHQEVGWALGRRVPRYVVRMGVDPAGFIGREQWPAGGRMTPREIANVISGWVASIPALGERMVHGLFTALETANNYIDAGATANRIAALGGLTEDQWQRLNVIYGTNDQVFGGAPPTKALRPFYQEHGREWPPPQLGAATPPGDPWGMPAGSATPSS